MTSSEYTTIDSLMYECPECGAAVANTELHDEWHDHLENIAVTANRAYQTAQSADMMWRPIG